MVFFHMCISKWFSIHDLTRIIVVSIGDGSLIGLRGSCLVNYFRTI